MEGHEVLQKDGYFFDHKSLEPCIRGNHSRQVIPEKANRPVYDTEVAVDRRVRLNQATRADLEWWWQFSRRWNGVAMMVAVKALSPTHEMASDASGNWGCGAVYRRKWFQLQWQGLGNTQSLDIIAKELLPIVVAAAVWG